jgi:microcompartment protein CcmK/EutM
MNSRRIMVVQPIDPVTLKPIGKSFISVDRVSSGPGEIVLVNKEGGSSRIAVRWEEAPIHSTINAIVDDTTIRNNTICK